MKRRILESIEGAADVIDACRMEPVMDQVGDCAVYNYDDAMQRIAQSYGIEPKGAAFEMLVSPFRGYGEILEIEFCDLHNPQEAKGILRRLDDEFKKHGLDLMEDRYPINSVPVGKIHDNGPVTHVAFVPVLKSPEKRENAAVQIQTQTQKYAQPEPEQQAQAQIEPTPEPEPEPEQQTQPASDGNGSNSDEGSSSEQPPSGGYITAYLTNRRRRPAPMSVINDALGRIVRSLENEGHGEEVEKDSGFEYQVMAYSTKCVRNQILYFRKQRRSPNISVAEDRALKFNDAAICVYMRPVDGNTITRQDRKRMAEEAARIMKRIGFGIRGARFFAHKIQMSWKDKDMRGVGYDLYLPFAIGRKRG